MPLNIRGAVRHLFAPPWAVRRALPPRAIDRIEAAIAASEAKHRGEIRFAVEGALDFARVLKGLTPRTRALELFSELGVWDTAENSGVLLYLQLIDRDVEIVADRGIAQAVPQAEWDAICHAMEDAFRDSRYVEGVIAGIDAVSARLEAQFPARATNPNELPDNPVVL